MKKHVVFIFVVMVFLAAISCSKDSVIVTKPVGDSLVVLKNDFGDNSFSVGEAIEIFYNGGFKVWGSKYDTAHYDTGKLTIKVPKRYTHEHDNGVVVNRCSILGIIKSEKEWAFTGSNDALPFKEVTLIFSGPADNPEDLLSQLTNFENVDWIWEVKKITPFNSNGSIYMPGVNYQARNTVAFDLSTAQKGKRKDFLAFLKKNFPKKN